MEIKTEDLLINELINCSFPLNAIIFDAYCKEYKNINTIQVSIMNLIFDHKRLNMTNLARRLGYTNQRLTQPVDDLVRRGYLTRTVEDNNRRMVYVSLTENGENYLKVSREKAHEATMALLRKAMTEDELNKLLVDIKHANVLLERLNNIKL